MKRLADQTLYEILEIPQDASSPAIEAAVERARALYGPGSLVTYTLMSPDEAALLGSRIDEARKVLLDPDARSRYDASLGSGEGELRAAASGTNGVAAAPANGVATAGASGVAASPVNGVPSASGSSGPNGAATPIFAPVPVIPAVQPQAEPRSVPAPPPASPEPPEASEEAPSRIALREPVETPPPVSPRAPIRLERELHAPAAAARPPPVPPSPAPAPGPEDVPLPEGAAWTGEALRRVREARGITVQQIADRTKVTRHHVENIEAERFTALPAPVYLRGILLAMARELRLDGQKVARAYLDRAAAAAQGGKR